MAKTNYGYEKRQRDLAKKKKKEEKMQKKLSKGKTSSPDQPDSALPSESQEISEHSENKGMGLDLPAEETGTTETEDQTPLP